MRTLCELQPGQRACVGGLLSQGGMRRRLMDVGLIEHTEVECLGRSPGGDPAAYLIRGAGRSPRPESEDRKSVV